MRLNRELESELEKKFSVLKEYKRLLPDELVRDSDYAQYRDNLLISELPEANPDILTSEDTLWNIDYKHYNLEYAIDKIKLSETDKVIIDCYLKNYKQYEIAAFISVRPEYVSKRIQSMIGRAHV